MDLGLRREAQISEESNTMYTLKTNKSEIEGDENNGDTKIEACA